MDNEKFQELVLQQLQALNNRLGNVENGQQSLEHGQKSFQKEIETIRQSVARIEHDHGEKLSALLDGYKLLSETITDHTARLERIEEKIAGHDVRIQILDKTKSNKRKAK
ncbi:hypothetical protein SY88_02225 [Clostridiales bacterium PH28_bin88]|nr:hypothetical protein SY88_02225 [Clostridiales bacterium PH28_bin88]